MIYLKILLYWTLASIVLAPFVGRLLRRNDVEPDCDWSDSH